MTKQVQRRRGTATQHTSFTGAEGEISVNTTNKSVHVHDGVTAGGVEAARADLDNVTSSDILTAAGITSTVTEINYTDGVTSNIQSQIDAKAPVNSATFTGTTTIPTADINGGTIDGTVIGATTPAAITGTTGQFNTSLNVDGTITSDGLTVDGNISAGLIGDFTGVAPRVQLFENDTIDENTTIIQSGGQVSIRTISDDGSTTTKRLAVDHGTGDIQFFEDTGTTAKFFWDASAESLGLGTVSPQTLLHLSGGGNAIVRLENNSSSLTTNSLLGSTQFYSNDPSGLGVGVKASVNAYSENSTGSAYYMTFNTTSFSGSNDTERMRIDSSGFIKAVTSITSDPTDTGAYWYNKSGVGPTLSGFQFSVRTGGTPTEAMRIDSSGALLVGKTAANTGTTGIQLVPNGLTAFTRSGDHTVRFNRLTSDGDVVVFQKDGTTVGSIASRAGVVSSIVLDPRTGGSAITAGQVGGTQPYITSSNNSGSSEADATVNLGKSTSRFKDLYLSGGVYLGGTGAANKLDDYEEGTWTPGLNTVWAGPSNPLSSSTGFYTKIGNLVTCVVNLNFAESGTTVAVDHRFAIGSLPFSPNTSNVTGAGTVWVYGALSAGNNALGSVGLGAGSTAYIYITHTDGTTNYADPINFVFSYTTSA